MTVSTTTSTITYLGNGATTLFSFPFIGVTASDIEVSYTDIDGVITVLGNTQYTLVFNAVPVGGLWGIGGSVTYPITGTPIQAGTFLTITRVVPYTQTVSISNQGAFYPQTIEQALDKLEFQIQQLSTFASGADGFALTYPLSDGTSDGSIPSRTARATHVLGFDSVGVPIVTNSTVAQIDAVVTASTTTPVATPALDKTSTLLNLYGSSVTLVDGTTFITGARSVLGDNGGCLFRYKASDTTTADNGGTIRVDTQGRRWYAIIYEDNVRAEIFGATTSSSNNTVAINLAFVGAALLGKSVTFATGGTFICTGKLTYDMSKTSLDMNGATLDFSGIGTGTAIEPMTTWSDPNSQTGVHNMRPFCNGRIIGPSNQGKCIKGVALSILGTPYLSGGIYEDLQIEGFRVFYTLVDGNAVGLTFRNVYFGSTTTHSSNFFLSLEASVNAGENVLLDHCFVINADGGIIDVVGNANVTITADSCSFDNVTYILTGGSVAVPGTAGFGSKVTFLSGHWEPVQYTQYLIWTSSNGQVNGFGIQQIVSTLSITHVPFRSDSVALTTGIVLTNHNISANIGAWSGTGQICDGDGNFELNSKASGNTFIVNASKTGNRVPNYIFPSSGSLTTNWTGTPLYDPGTKPAGATASAALNSAHPTTSFTTTCLPGQYAACQAQVQWIGVGAGDTLTLLLEYLDKGGNTLTLNLLTRSATIPAFALQDVTIQGLAPAGTISARMSLTYVPSFGGATAYMALPQLIIS